MSGRKLSRIHHSVITDLALTARPVAVAKPRLGLQKRGLRLETVTGPSLAFYRQLYHDVGAPWLWWEQKTTPDPIVQEQIDRPGFHLVLLSGRASILGYAALAPEATTVNLDYFGLMPQAIGQGLGSVFLYLVAARAWRLAGAAFLTGGNAARSPRVTVNTCDLDHPRAMAAYLRAGFHKTGQRRNSIDLKRARRVAAVLVLSV